MARITAPAAIGLGVLALAGRARAEEPTEAPSPEAPRAESPPPAEAKVAGSPSAGVRVRFEPSEPHVVLERWSGPRRGDQVDSEGTTAICVSGCETTLDPKEKYQVGGTWVTPATFWLPKNEPGPLRIRVVPGSSRTEGWGTGFVLAGGGALLLGAAGAITTLATGSTKNTDGSEVADHVLTASITSAALGVALILLSLPFRASTTHVKIEPLPAAPK